MVLQSTATLARSGTQTVERALAILKAVGSYTPFGATLADITQAVRLNRTTTYRLLRYLVREGAVRVDGDNKYCLGPLVLNLGAAARRNQELKELFAPLLSHIAEVTGDTVFLQLRSGTESVCVDRRLGAYPVQTLIVDVGTHRPLGVGTGGVAILAASPAQEADNVIKANAASFPSYGVSAFTITQAVRMARKLGDVSASVPGVPGVRAVAVPIMNQSGYAVAAIAVAAITQRMSRARQSKLVEIVRSELKRVAKYMRG